MGVHFALGTGRGGSRRNRRWRQAARSSRRRRAESCQRTTSPPPRRRSARPLTSARGRRCAVTAPQGIRVPLTHHRRSLLLAVQAHSGADAQAFAGHMRCGLALPAADVRNWPADHPVINFRVSTRCTMPTPILTSRPSPPAAAGCGDGQPRAQPLQQPQRQREPRRQAGRHGAVCGPAHGHRARLRPGACAVAACARAPARPRPAQGDCPFRCCPFPVQCICHVYSQQTNCLPVSSRTSEARD